MSKNNIPPGEKKKGLDFSFGKKKEPTTTNITHEQKMEHTYVPELPLVNVIPNSIFERYQVKGIIRKLAFAGIAVVAVLALSFVGGKALVATQTAKIDAISQELSEVTLKSQELTPFEAYQNAVDSKRQALNAITSTDVNMGTMYQSLLTISDQHNIQLDDINVIQYETSSGENNSCTNPDPFQTNQNIEIIIGCVTLKGGTNNQESIQAFLETLESYNGTPGSYYRDAFISSFTSSDGNNGPPHMWEANISFSDAFFTGKYDHLSKSLAEVLTGDVTTDEPVVKEPTDEEETSEEVTDPNVPVVTAGPLGQYAVTLFPDFTVEETLNIDSIGYAFCQPNSGLTPETLATSLNGLILEGHPTTPEAETLAIVGDLMLFIDPNCQAIITHKEKEN